MLNAVLYCSFKLKEGANIPDFLLAAERLNNGFISKQKGYISWQQLVSEDTWVDFITFETMADAQKFESESVNAGELAEKFYSFLNLDSCQARYFTIERSYQKE